MNKVEIAKKKLEIVKLRNLAEWQMGDYAQSHYRQAEKPLYPGQEFVCFEKAAQAERMAKENLAKADLLETELTL